MRSLILPLAVTFLTPPGPNSRSLAPRRLGATLGWALGLASLLIGACLGRAASPTPPTPPAPTRPVTGTLKLGAPPSPPPTNLAPLRTNTPSGQAVAAEEVGRLAAEVHAKGWIVYSARSSQGDWDLFACRPDGSGVRALTRTPEFSEFYAQVSRDGTQLLYRRLPRGGTVDPNRHGAQGELIVSSGDGRQPTVVGRTGEFAWASWGPDGRHIACLDVTGIQIVELATRRIIRKLPRQGFFQQMTWSPDGEWLVGVANGFAKGWTVARVNVASGEASPINRLECCTPDWFADSRRVIFSWRPPGQRDDHDHAWTQLWMADAEGQTRRLLYAEEGRNLYGGFASPDGRYVVFTGNQRAGGDPDHDGSPMSVLRVADAPIIGGEHLTLRIKNPQAKSGPLLKLPAGWEPVWTAAPLFPNEASTSTPARQGP